MHFVSARGSRLTVVDAAFLRRGGIHTLLHEGLSLGLVGQREHGLDRAEVRGRLGIHTKICHGYQRVGKEGSRGSLFAVSGHLVRRAQASNRSLGLSSGFDWLSGRVG